MATIAHHATLKEWAAVISALCSGDQLLLLRKGGIADARFGVEAPAFYLFPTYLHQKEKQFKPSFLHHFHSTDRSDAEPESVDVVAWAEVMDTFRITELDALRRLDPFVVFTRDTIDERYHFRPDQAVHAITVRCWKLARPARVVVRREYQGCRSWISIDEPVAIDGSIPVLSDEEILLRRHAIRSAIRSGGSEPQES